MKYDKEDAFFYARHLKYKAMEEGWGITEMIFEVPEEMYNPEKTTLCGIKVIKGRDDIPRLYVGYSPNDVKLAREKAEAQEALKNKAIAEEVATDICNHYCKYPLIWDEDAEEVELSESEICNNCPMKKIMEMFGGNK